MKYNQPFGISDPLAPYINGNPSTGTMGSIPPAAAIEYPQREIHNFINYSAITPANTDLSQMAKSIQSGWVNWSQDVGGANLIVINPALPVTAYKVGLRFLIKVAAQNASFVTVNVSALGTKQLIHCDGTPIQAWELRAGQLIEIGYDGTAFQLLAGGVMGGPIFLTAPRHLYVNSTTGSDTLYDGTTAGISGASGPFATTRKALSTLQKYNLGGWDFYIHFADGTYPDPASIRFPMPNGSGVVHLNGNDSNPQACRIFNSSAGCAWIIADGGVWTVSGFSFKTTSPIPGDNGSGLVVAGASQVTTGHMNFETLAGSALFGGPGGGVLHGGNHTITGASMEAYFQTFANGVNFNNVPTAPNLNIINPCYFVNSFCLAGDGAQARPIFNTISNFGNASGYKFNASGNAVIQTGGRGVNYLPGNAAGYLSSGGQYL